MSKKKRAIGLDFGTTNSSLAVSGPDGTVDIARFRNGAEGTESYRSVLYFEPPARSLKSSATHVFAGPAAIEHYLAADPKGRLIQSIKSLASSKLFTSTNIFGRTYTFEELVVLLVKRMASEAEEQFGALGESVTVGRPVRFAGAHTAEEEELAVSRIRKALEMCGFSDVRFEFEPIGAAYFYDRQLDHDELVLIGDFGGGTSDFSLLRVGPSTRTGRSRTKRIIGNDGVGIAGDTFDGSIIRNLVSPRLGMGGEIRSGHKLLPVPSWIYFKLERWHHMSFLKDKDTLEKMRSVTKQALEPEKLQALQYLVENDLGYFLHSAVQETKISLSQHQHQQFLFTDGDLEIREDVARASFEHWVSAHLQSISDCIYRLMQKCGVTTADVDRVFLTGGSSFVPAVRQIFSERFGAEKIAGGSEFTSVAKGLAMRAAEPR